MNARPMLQDVLVALPRTTDNPRQIVFELGRYSFKQLASWRDDLTHFGFARIPVMHSIDVQESTNRIEVKVSVPEGVDDVRNVVTWLGIPTEAVSVSVEPADHDYADSLTKFKTPFAGGLKILQYANRQPCSIGFNTFAGTEFVTASHCTRVIGPDYPTLANFFQPDTTGLFIGSESDDASTFTDETGIYECPAFQQCRWSDAARVAYKSGFEPGAAGMGKIYKTTYSGTFAAGSLEISGMFTITAESEAPVVGMTLHKVGSTTGWTAGYTSQTCEDVRSNETGIYFLCQGRVSANATYGDSGSPVFAVNADGVTATMYGIVRGGTNVSFSFSPLSGIWEELGYLPTYTP